MFCLLYYFIIICEITQKSPKIGELSSFVLQKREMSNEKYFNLQKNIKKILKVFFDNFTKNLFYFKGYIEC